MVNVSQYLSAAVLPVPTTVTEGAKGDNIKQRKAETLLIYPSIYTKECI